MKGARTTTRIAIAAALAAMLWTLAAQSPALAQDSAKRATTPAGSMRGAADVPRPAAAKPAAPRPRPKPTTTRTSGSRRPRPWPCSRTAWASSCVKAKWPSAMAGAWPKRSRRRCSAPWRSTPGRRRKWSTSSAPGRERSSSSTGGTWPTTSRRSGPGSTPARTSRSACPTSTRGRTGLQRASSSRWGPSSWSSKTSTAASPCRWRGSPRCRSWNCPFASTWPATAKRSRKRPRSAWPTCAKGSPGFRTTR